MLGARPWPRARGGRWRATLAGSEGVFGGCTLAGTALKWPLFYLSALEGTRMIKAIFWDNDGVLVDTENLYFLATEQVLATVGIPLTKEQYIDPTTPLF